MSLEAVFAVLAGMVVLGETLTLRELLGSVLMFAAILFAQRAEPPRPVEGARPVLPGPLLRK
jgi:drug/metabolite transporter (DMT)-like permease